MKYDPPRFAFGKQAGKETAAKAIALPSHRHMKNNSCVDNSYNNLVYILSQISRKI